MIMKRLKIHKRQLIFIYYRLYLILVLISSIIILANIFFSVFNSIIGEIKYISTDLPIVIFIISISLIIILIKNNYHKSAYVLPLFSIFCFLIYFFIKILESYYLFINRSDITVIHPYISIFLLFTGSFFAIIFSAIMLNKMKYALVE